MTYGLIITSCSISASSVTMNVSVPSNSSNATTPTGASTAATTNSNYVYVPTI